MLAVLQGCRYLCLLSLQMPEGRLSPSHPGLEINRLSIRKILDRHEETTYKSQVKKALDQRYKILASV